MDEPLPTDDDTISLPAETERASRGSDGPPNLEDVNDQSYSLLPSDIPNLEQDSGSDVLIGNVITEKGEYLDRTNYNDNELKDNNFNDEINNHIVSNVECVNSDSNADNIDNSNKPKSVTISLQGSQCDSEKENVPHLSNGIQDKPNQHGDAKEKAETKPRLLILDMSGEGAVYSLRLDPVRERLVVGKTVEPEYWRPIRALKDYGVVVYENELYIIGGFSLEDRKCSTNVTK